MPEIGDRERGTKIGYKSDRVYEFVECIVCHKQRWADAVIKPMRCKRCSIGHQKKTFVYGWRLKGGPPPENYEERGNIQ